MDAKRRTVVIMSYKLKELAGIYKTSLYLMRRSLEEHKRAIGKRKGYFYKTEQVELIFQLIALPSDVDLVVRNNH
jgi:hypothetical protein